MLVEVYGTSVPDGPGGLKNLEYSDGGFINQARISIIVYCMTTGVNILQNSPMFTGEYP